MRLEIWGELRYSDLQSSIRVQAVKVVFGYSGHSDFTNWGISRA